MGTEQRPSQVEVKEAVQVPHAIWLAGGIEVGGAIGFSIQKYLRNGNLRINAMPSIKVRQNEAFGQEMHQLYGGSLFYDKSSQSIQWSLSGRKVVSLCNAIAPYAPSRNIMIEAILEWEQLTTKERVDLAESVKGESANRAKEVSKNDYLQLVQMPQFRAGIIDCRPTFENKRRLELQVYTTNKPLLEALKEVYEGSISINYEAGKTYMMKGQPVTLRRDSWGWQITHNKAENFLRGVLPYLLVNGDRVKKLLEHKS